jgi:hypothetical protein
MLTTIFLTIIFQIRTEFKMLGPARGTVVGNHCCIGGSIGQLRGKTKQWPFDSEFVKFEYSPKWPFWKIGRTR